MKTIGILFEKNHQNDKKKFNKKMNVKMEDTSYYVA